MHTFWNMMKTIKDQFFESPLFYRIYYNDLAGVRAYCHSAPSSELNSLNSVGITPLILAVHGRNLKMIQTLIDAGADVNGTDHKGRTAFIHSLMKQDKIFSFEIMDLLIRNGADINEADKLGRHSVFYAINTTETKTLDYVLSHGGNPNHQTTDGSTPILHAVQMCCVEAVQHLMSFGANMYMENKNGLTGWQAVHQVFSETVYQTLKSFEHHLLICSSHQHSDHVLKQTCEHTRD